MKTAVAKKSEINLLSFASILVICNHKSYEKSSDIIHDFSFSFLSTLFLKHVQKEKYLEDKESKKEKLLPLSNITSIKSTLKTLKSTII